MTKEVTYRRPLEAIRAKCVECSAGEYSRVTNCRALQCKLHPYRHGRRPEDRTGLKSPLKTIRARCLQCNGTPNEVNLCQVTDCELFMFRSGHNPRLAGKDVSHLAKYAFAKSGGVDGPSGGDEGGGAISTRLEDDRAATPHTRGSAS